MANLGVFQRNQVITLELLINSAEIDALELDYNPSAAIAYLGASREKTMSSVTLNKVESENLVYQKDVQIGDDWFYGDYKITYTYVANETKFYQEHTFSITSEQDFAKQQDEYLQNLIQDFEEGSYFPSKYEQETVEIIPAAHEIQILFSEQLKYNHTYKIVIDGVKSVSGDVIRKEIIAEFDTEYKPLYSNPIEIQSLINEFYSIFTAKEIYIAIRNASQKAMIYLSQIADPNNSRFKEYNERNTPYFAMTKYVAHEASLALLQDLFAKYMKATTPSLNPDGTAEETLIGSGFTLGDLSVQGAEGSNDKEILLLSSKEFVAKLNPLIRRIKAEMVYWRDSMMSRNRRGYASASYGSYRSDAGSPESREF